MWSSLVGLIVFVRGDPQLPACELVMYGISGSPLALDNDPSELATQWHCGAKGHGAR
jgi:hypothetical protein